MHFYFPGSFPGAFAKERVVCYSVERCCVSFKISLIHCFYYCYDCHFTFWSWKDRKHWKDWKNNKIQRNITKEVQTTFGNQQFPKNERLERLEKIKIDCPSLLTNEMRRKMEEESERRRKEKKENRVARNEILPKPSTSSFLHFSSHLIN